MKVRTLISLLVFIFCYTYIIARYGFLWGAVLGWIPAGIIAAIGGGCWPLTVGLAIYFILVHQGTITSAPQWVFHFIHNIVNIF